MLTKQEEARLIERCRYVLRKQGLKLEKTRKQETIYYHPGTGRYRITEAGAGDGAQGFPLTFQDVLHAAGLA